MMRTADILSGVHEWFREVDCSRTSHLRAEILLQDMRCRPLGSGAGHGVGSVSAVGGVTLPVFTPFQWTSSRLVAYFYLQSAEIVDASSKQQLIGHSRRGAALPEDEHDRKGLFATAAHVWRTSRLVLVAMLAVAFVIALVTESRGYTVQYLSVAAWALFVCLPILRRRKAGHKG